MRGSSSRRYFNVHVPRYSTIPSVALEPGSAVGFRLRGWIQYSRGHIQDAVRSLKAALELDPNDADTLLLLCNCYLISGKVPAVRPLIGRLQALDPLTPLVRCLPGFADASEGDLESAIEPYRQMLEMDPNNPMARLFYVWVLALNGHHDALVRVLDGFSVVERDTVPSRVARFLAGAIVTREKEAFDLVSPEVEAVAATNDVFARFLAEGYAMAGAVESAIRWLSVAVDRGYINYPFLARYDPCFEPVRGHPQFRQLIEVVRGRWQRFET